MKANTAMGSARQKKINELTHKRSLSSYPTSFSVRIDI
jgi:hypothetical protein